MINPYEKYTYEKYVERRKKAVEKLLVEVRKRTNEYWISEEGWSIFIKKDVFKDEEEWFDFIRSIKSVIDSIRDFRVLKSWSKDYWCLDVHI